MATKIFLIFKLSEIALYKNNTAIFQNFDTIGFCVILKILQIFSIASWNFFPNHLKSNFWIAVFFSPYFEVLQSGVSKLSFKLGYLYNSNLKIDY